MVIGSLSYPGLNLINRLQVNGMEKLRSLPKSNVMFVSNHQTYFAEVIAMLHIFGAVSWGKKESWAFLTICCGLIHGFSLYRPKKP